MKKLKPSEIWDKPSKVVRDALSTPTHQSLRDRFKEFESNTSVLGDVSDEISDFFLSQFSSDCQEVIEKLEAEKRDKVKGEEELWAAHYLGLNEGIDLAISLIREMFNEYK